MLFQNKFVGLPNRFKLAFKFFGVFIIFVYFIFHAITGENGFFSYLDIKKKVEKLNIELTKMVNEKKHLETLTTLLSNQSLDTDLLEERCRTILNYAYPNEIIINN